MIEIVGGGLAAAKLVEGYREAGGDDEITIWSQDRHGPYHRPPLSKRVLRGEAEAESSLVHPHAWYAENGVHLRLGVRSGVVVDECFRTTQAGVYAIGDVAEFFDPLYRRHRRIEHWSNAAYHGTTLGQILAGEGVCYDIVSAFFSEEFGRSFKVFG